MPKMGFQVTDDNNLAIANSRVVILCVQPNQVKKVLDDVGVMITSDHMLVSVDTGIPISQIQGLVSSDVPVIRAMPNTANCRR